MVGIRLTHEEFLSRFNNIHNLELLTEYVNAKTKIKVRDPEGFEHELLPCSLVRGATTTAKTVIDKTLYFTTRSSVTHNNFYDYSRVKYTTNFVKVEIGCPIHGYFWQTPQSHLSGRGCNRCNYENRYKDKRKGEKYKCSKCGEYKNPSEYYRNKQQKSGLTASCKKCTDEVVKAYQDKNPEKVKERRQQYYEKVKNTQGFKDTKKKWENNNKEKLSAYHRKRTKYIREIFPLKKMKMNLRVLIKNSFLNKNSRKNKTTQNILKCNYDFFREHIESQFESWMSWDNYGSCDSGMRKCSWHLDHIIPLNYANNKKEIELLNHWSNFQPMCGIENISKGSTIYECCNVELKIRIKKDGYIQNI